MRLFIDDYRAVVGLMSYSPRTRSASPCSTTGRRVKTCRQDFPPKSKVSRTLDNLSMLMYSVVRKLPTQYIIPFTVIDLYDGEQYSNLSKTHAYSNVRKLNG